MVVEQNEDGTETLICYKCGKRIEKGSGRL
jgi:hypothetical protein